MSKPPSTAAVTENTAQDADRLMRLREVQERVALGKTSIYALIADGQFPKPRKIKPMIARWSEREINAWIAETAPSG